MFDATLDNVLRGGIQLLLILMTHHKPQPVIISSILWKSKDSGNTLSAGLKGPITRLPHQSLSLSPHQHLFCFPCLASAFCNLSLNHVILEGVALPAGLVPRDICLSALGIHMKSRKSPGYTGCGTECSMTTCSTVSYTHPSLGSQTEWLILTHPDSVSFLQTAHAWSYCVFHPPLKC